MKESPHIQGSMLNSSNKIYPLSDVKRAQCLSPPHQTNNSLLLTFQASFAHKHTLSAKVSRKPSSVLNFSDTFES